MSTANTVTRAADFTDSIGYDTHLPYTDGQYANVGLVQTELSYLGVDEVRDGITDGKNYQGQPNGSATIDHYIALAKAGVKFTISIDAYQATTATVDYQLSLVKELLAAVPGSVTAVEGPNEINNEQASFNGATGQDAAVALQRYVYGVVHSDAAFTSNHVAVDYFTGYGATGSGEGPDPSTTPGLADYDNQHSYPQGQAPAYYELPSTTLPNEATPGKFVYTETGYTTNPADSTGVTEDYRARATLDLYADAYADGSSHTDTYQLMQAYAPGGDSDYGAFKLGGTPTPEATAIHDLTSILHDDGSTATTFNPTAVGITLTGLPSSGRSLQLQKSDGATDLMVRAETPPSIPATPSTVTATLDSSYDVSVYDPLLGATPVATYADVSSVQLQVTDHPLVVELTQASGGTAGTTPTPVGTTPAPTVTPAPVTTGSGTPTTTTPSPTTTPAVTSTPPATTTDPTPAVTPAPTVTSTPAASDPAPVATTTPDVPAPTVTAPAPSASTPATVLPTPTVTNPAPVVTSSPTPSGTSPVPSPAPDPGTTAATLTPRERALFRLDTWIQSHLAPGVKDKVGAADVMTAALGTDAHYAADLRLLRAEDHGADAQIGLGEMERRLGVEVHDAYLTRVQADLHHG